ncbi:DUF3742 family protein [Pseudomonas sp. TNT2022 ID357]|uniref:DUF3742 family protein n=1 Tax=Pseudomonas idahonensis TaxID=2942628 RepID=A0ABT5Q490_9PSED|nr:DUF3742 family protein [Pseudomonas idahonensis]MDD1148839.1 DUF3742 family protein [Pseudomonas idahonensis]
MSKIKHPTEAERLGRWLGGVWQGLVRRDAQLAVWLNDKGLSIGATKTLIWLLRLAFFGLLFYVALWLVLIVVFALAAAWVARNSPPTDWSQNPPGGPEDPKECLSYDPMNSDNDYSDERFPKW